MQRTAGRNTRLYLDLEDALCALDGAGIPAIVLKGAALAATVYPGIGWRPMADVDILVHPEDRDKARAALKSARYDFLPEPRRLFSPFNTEFTGEMSFMRSPGVIIELHWELTACEWLRRLSRIDMLELWRCAQPLDLPGLRSLQLAPKDLLLHVCLHLAAHAYVHPPACSDIRQLLDRYQPFPWEDFLARARAFRLVVACYFALDMARSSAGAAVPEDVLERLRPPIWRAWLMRRLGYGVGAPVDEHSASVQRAYYAQLAVADRPVDILGVVAWLFFPGRRWLAERYRLAGTVRSWLACLWHPLVVLWQAALGLRHLRTRD